MRDRLFWRVVLLALLAALGFRVGVFLACRDWIVLRVPVLDAGYYDTTAHDLLAGRWPGREPYFMGPFYTYLLAGIYALPGPDLLTIRIVQMVMGLALVLAGALVTRRLFGAVAGAIAACLFTAYGPFVFFEQIPLIETTVLLFTVLLFERALAWRRAGSFWAVAPTGLLLGALVVLRGTSVLYAAPLAAMLGRRAISRNGVLALALAIAVVAPFSWHNRSVGSRALTTTSLGWNLFVGNQAHANGLFVYPNGWRAETDPTGRTFASIAAGHALSPDETDAYFRARTREFLATHPAKALTLAARKLGFFFQAEEVPQNESYRFFLRNVPIARAGVLGWWFALPAALAAIIVLRARPPGFVALVGFIVVPAIVCVVFFVTSRYRLAAAPFLLILASGGLAAWFRARGSLEARDWIAAMTLIAGGFVLLVLPPPFDRARALAREYEHVGLRYQMEGSLLTAEENYRRAVGLYPGDGDAWNNLGTTLVRLEKLEDAEAAFIEAARAEPQNPTPLLNLGLLRGHARDHVGAERYFRGASAIDPGNADILINLGTSLAVQERLPEAIDAFERALRIDPTNATARSMLMSARELLDALESQSLSQERTAEAR